MYRDHFQRSVAGILKPMRRVRWNKNRLAFAANFLRSITIDPPEAPYNNPMLRLVYSGASTIVRRHPRRDAEH